MTDTRTIVTAASLALALLCAGWAIYESKHDSPGGNSQAGAQGRSAGAAGAPGNPNAGGQGGSSPPVNVVTAVATRRQINVGIEAIGTAGANESVNISSKTSNIVTAIHFSDGQAVRTGQILVELDRAQASADLAAATADFVESQSQYNRSRDLVETQVVSKSQYEQLEGTMKANAGRVAAAQARLSDTYIKAPFSGHVGLRRVSLGTLISPGTVITTLDDVSSMKVDFAVPDLYVGELRPGQLVTAHSNAYPGRMFEGKVVSIDSRIDPATRAVIVRAEVPNRDSALKPGMFLTVDLSKERRDALLVPEEALVPEQARQFVYVVEGAVVAKREVRLGRREPGSVEITEGIAAGDRVVIEGAIKLRDGAAVKELPASVTAPAAPATAPATAPAAAATPAAS
jgi:membrane fusion protein (multidrug efflux system)